MPRKQARKERVYRTNSIEVAFRAAFGMWKEQWDSPEGPAVVTEVDQAIGAHGGGWWITYRLIKTWGKEAWS